MICIDTYVLTSLILSNTFYIKQLHTFLGCCLFSVGVVIVIKDCKLNACLHSYVTKMLPFGQYFNSKERNTSKAPVC